MVQVKGEIVINRQIEDVFDFVADQRNEPRYNPQMRRAEKTTDGPIGVGTQFRAETVSWGRAVEMVIKVTAFERPRLLEQSTTLSSMNLHGGLMFEAVAGGTRMRWSWELEPRGFFRLLSPLVALMGRRQERSIWMGLKGFLEHPSKEASA